ncbi:NUDIX hydrolase [Brevundimonas sp.]|uniref:NUDIX hydrolase n=1 Tax=Brevundimonas sp. TaxID=1871086 RepID=UPI002FC61EBE
MIVYENPWFHVVKEGNFHIIKENTKGEGAVVLPVVGDRLLLLEMRRPSQNMELTLEIPRGFGDVGENAVTCARRELREETGYDLPLDAFQPIGHVRANTGILRSRVAVFAVQISVDMARMPPDDEAEGMRLVPLSDLPALIADGQIEDGFTLSALMFYKAVRR